MITTRVKSLFRKLGYDIVKSDSSYRFADFEAFHNAIIEKVSPYTMTSPERLYALIESVRYCVRNNISGVFIECGVYKGGSMMAIALALMSEGILDRDLYLFDTFEGMPEPGDKDIDLWGETARDTFAQLKTSDTSSSWSNCSMDEVRQAMAATGYPAERIHYVMLRVWLRIPFRRVRRILSLCLDWTPTGISQQFMSSSIYIRACRQAQY